MNFFTQYTKHLQNIANMIAKVVGIDIEGVDHRDPAEEVEDFMACRQMHECVPHVATTAAVRKAIEDFHAKQERCYLYIKTRRETNGYVPIMSVVTSDVNRFEDASKDVRFKQYVASYDMNFLLPVYMSVANGDGFFASIIGQPWIDQTEILRRLMKK